MRGSNRLSYGRESITDIELRKAYDGGGASLNSERIEGLPGEF
jgi:hypothetical protein